MKKLSLKSLQLNANVLSNVEKKSLFGGGGAIGTPCSHCHQLAWIEEKLACLEHCQGGNGSDGPCPPCLGPDDPCEPC